MKNPTDKLIHWYHALYRGREGHIVWSASAAGLTHQDYEKCPHTLQKEMDTFQKVSKQKHQIINETFLGFNGIFLFIITAIGISYSGHIPLAQLLMLMFAVPLFTTALIDGTSVFRFENVSDLIRQRSKKIFLPLTYFCLALFLSVSAIRFYPLLTQFKLTLAQITPYLTWTVQIEEYQWIAILFTVLVILDAVLVITPLSKSLYSSYRGWKEIARRNPVWCKRHLSEKHQDAIQSTPKSFDDAL